MVRLTQADHALVTVAASLAEPGRLDFDHGSNELLVTEGDAFTGGGGSNEGGGKQQIVRVSTTSGTVLHTYGADGGRHFGLYDDAARRSFSGVTDVCADGHGGFFEAETYSPPRRVAHIAADGSVLQEWYGGLHWAPHGEPEAGQPQCLMDQYRRLARS